VIIRKWVTKLFQAKIDVAEYMKTLDLMDEKTVTLLTDPADLAIGKTITTNCALVIELMVEDKLVLNH
jgi:hypothetical protein